MGELDTDFSVVSCENLHGRRKVFTDRRAVTDENVLEVLGKTLPIFQKNKAESKYLYDVYRGIQDIRHKEKMVRPEINNKITVNIANQIVAFDSAYFMNGPVQYVSSGEEKDVSDDIKRLNDFMRAEDKESRDKEIVDWQLICGQSIRMIIPAEEGDESGSPFKVYTLSPMEAYVIYHSGIGHKKLAGVIEQRDQDGNTYYCVYTKDKYYEIQDGKIITNLPRTLHVVPLVEYIDNLPRIGAFEIVLPILNGINDLESSRVDNVQDFVNAYDVFQNCEISDDAYRTLTQGGQAIQIKSSTQGIESKVYRITSELSQSGVQTAIDDLTDRYIEICGLPNRNGGLSTSDTGVAVQYRDGWAEADSREHGREKLFDKSENESLDIALKICADAVGMTLKLSDIKIEHAHNNLSNMQSRMQILCEGLANEKIHPKIPWLVSGMPNTEEWYQMSMDWYEKNQAEMEQSLRREVDAENGQSVLPGGSSGGTSEQEGDQAVRGGAE